MKKLKTWQIVLLVIFYPVGICVLIYRLWKKNELKKEAAEADRLRAEEKARKEAEREEARRREEAYRATVPRERFRVVGVPCKNPGGRNRQPILREINKDEPLPFHFSLRKYEYEGKPAVGVFYGEEQVGSISTGDLKRALSQIDRFERVESYDVRPGLSWLRSSYPSKFPQALFSQFLGLFPSEYGKDRVRGTRREALSSPVPG